MFVILHTLVRRYTNTKYIKYKNNIVIKGICLNLIKNEICTCGLWGINAYGEAEANQ